MNRLILTITLGLFVFSANATSCNIEKDDDAKNFSRCLESASLGYVDAQFNVAYKYYYGIGIPQDYNQAFKWYMKSAKQGNYLAQNILGSMYYNGNGTHQDYKQAANWYMKSAKQGHPYAPFNLGKMYYLGEGVPQDFMYSHMWNNIAARKGIKKAAKFRNELEKKMTPAQIGEAQELAKVWMTTHKEKKLSVRKFF